ncbi:hypothetical protein V6N13_065560 [Hibiscus sabdariffa]
MPTTAADQEVVVEDDSERMLSNIAPETISPSNVNVSLPSVHRNAAYLASNLHRKNKKNLVGNNGGFSVTVVPLGFGSRPEVVEYMHSRKSGRMGKENAFKGLRIHRTVDFRPSGRAVLADWIPSASNVGDKSSNQVHMEVCYEHDLGNSQAQEKIDNLVGADESEGVALPSGREIEHRQ